MLQKNSPLFISGIISFVYVGLGTIVVLVGFEKYQIFSFSPEHPLWQPLATATMPANIPLFGLVVVDNSFVSIFILQTTIFLLMWAALYFIVKAFSKYKPKKI